MLRENLEVIRELLHGSRATACTAGIMLQQEDSLGLEEELAAPDVLDGARFALQVGALLHIHQVARIDGVPELVRGLHAAGHQLLLQVRWFADPHVWRV